MKQQLAFEAYNPFRDPDWRHKRVLQMVDRIDQIAGRTTRRDDAYIKGLRGFIMRYRNGDTSARNQLGYEQPGLYWAYTIYEKRLHDREHTAELIEARLLAKQTNEEIAKELGTLPEVVEWYEALFFDVRTRFMAHDWVVNKILMPAFYNSRQPQDPDAEHQVRQPCSEPFFDSTLKFFAYYGGPFVLNYVISGFRRGAVARSTEEIGMWFDQQYMTRMRHRGTMAAQTFEVNRYNVMQLFELYNQIITIERNAKSQEQAQDTIHKLMGGFMREIGWAVGDEGAKLVRGTRLEAYDTGAVELRDNEVLQLSVGREPGTIQEVDLKALPAPRKPTGQEDQAHAHAQQGS